MYRVALLAFFVLSLGRANADDLKSPASERWIGFAEFNPLIKPDSIFVFGGAMSIGGLGSTEIFNYNIRGIKYDNHIVGGAYNHDFYRIGYGFTLGAEVGVADRFGEYAVCCDTVVKSSSVLNSGELWAGARVSYSGVVFFDSLRIGGAMTTGVSLTTDSIGRERQREINNPGNARALVYLGPELVFSTLGYPDIELVYRVHHRSGANRTIGNMREGYNANVLGIRYSF